MPAGGCGPPAFGWYGTVTRRPVPRRAPRGGSLLGLLLPAPLGVEPWQPALCGARVEPCDDVQRRLRSGRAAQQHRIRTKRHGARSRVAKLNGFDLSPGPRRNGRSSHGGISPAHAPSVTRHTPDASTGTGLHNGTPLPAVAQTRTPALARRQPGTREREGETTAPEWSLPRRGAGAQPRALPTISWVLRCGAAVATVKTASVTKALFFDEQPHTSNNLAACSYGGDLGSTGVGRLRLRARDPGYRKTPGLLKRRRTSSTGCLRAVTSHRLAPVGPAEATQIGISGGEGSGAADENQRAGRQGSCSWESCRREQITKLRT
jgi:hypothetical protein